MQKEKYVNQNKQKSKEKLKIVFFILFAILLFLIISVSSIKSMRTEEKYDIKTEVKQIIEETGSTFVKMKNSAEDDFVYDIYLIFKYDLYEGEESKEDFYNDIINQIAETLQYKSFKLIDNDKQEKIEIKVICENEKISKIYINGIEDYFIYMNSQKSLSTYKEILNTELEIQAPELISCIQNNWKKDTNFGTRETIFQDYYIYFDEGIEVRKISGKIYNIIFTKNYVNSVVNGFTVGEKYDIIERELGAPIFKNEDETIIGYKSDDIYIFFEENQISIYRNVKETKYSEFFQITDKFLNDEYSLLEYMNELTYLWPDYEEYTYDANTVFLSYPNKGIDVKINYENTKGIVLYNNFTESEEIVDKYLQYTEFIGKLQIDNIYNAEYRRMQKINDFANKCKEYKEKFEAESTKNRGNIYDYYAKLSSDDDILGMYFISQNTEYPNCELNECIKSYIWAREDLFLYGVTGKGIYYYDLQNQTKGIITTGSDNFDIKSLENGVLTYDDKQIQINY